MKILIAVPTFENILPEVFKAIYDLDKCGHDAHFEFVKGYDCAKARNEIARKASGYDYVLMVDSDTVIPKDALANMLLPPTDIVLGCYPKKNTPGQAVLYTLERNPMGEGFNHPLHYRELEGTDRIELKGGGLGCALIDTNVFAAMDYPYFKYEVREDGVLSEDLYFCLKARSVGKSVQADPRVKCGHMKYITMR